MKILRTLALCVLVCLPGAAWAEGRVALVIGNSDYANVGRLTNPENDARDIGRALEGAGFEVEYGFDLTLSRTLEVLKGFRAKAARADVAVVYYAGHGIEVDRTNFMIPVDAQLASASDVEFETVPLDLTLGAVGAAAKLSLVIMDACRNNPFQAQMRRENTGRSIGRGLGAIEPVGNTLVAYAARDGTVAADGDGRNSPYAAALIKALETDGLEIGKLFRQVRDEVLAATGGEQEPFLYGSLSASDWYFRAPSAGGPAVPPPPPPPAASAGGGTPEAEIELAFWKTVQQTDTPEAYETYLQVYPEGRFAPIARLRMTTLKSAGAGERETGGAPSGDRGEKIATGPDLREVFRRTIPVHVGDETIPSWPAPRPWGRCFRANLGHDGHADAIRIDFEPYGAEGVIVAFAGRREVVRQQTQPGERRPNYWGERVRLVLPVGARIRRSDEVTICASEVDNPDRPGDRDDFMIRNLVIRVQGG